MKASLEIFGRRSDALNFRFICLHNFYISMRAADALSNDESTFKKHIIDIFELYSRVAL